MARVGFGILSVLPDSRLLVFPASHSDDFVHNYDFICQIEPTANQTVPTYRAQPSFPFILGWDRLLNVNVLRIKSQQQV
jgi:hypothetical protein